jgi:hypothetical protein
MAIGEQVVPAIQLAKADQRSAPLKTENWKGDDSERRIPGWEPWSSKREGMGSQLATTCRRATCLAAVNSCVRNHTRLHGASAFKSDEVWWACCFCLEGRLHTRTKR